MTILPPWEGGYSWPPCLPLPPVVPPGPARQGGVGGGRQVLVQEVGHTAALVHVAVHLADELAAPLLPPGPALPALPPPPLLVQPLVHPTPPSTLTLA